MKLLGPVAQQIVSLNVYQMMYGHRVVLRFTNDYGIEILKYQDEDFFKMTVIRFRGAAYEFAFDIPIPDLNLGYTDEDILRLCKDVSLLKKVESESRISGFEVRNVACADNARSQRTPDLNQLRAKKYLSKGQRHN